MIGTFLYLTACSLKNRVIRRVRRLRQPRYLVGLVVGVLYLYTFILRNQLRAARPGRGGLDPELLRSLAPDIIVGIAFVLWVVTVVVWLLPQAKPWRFTGAEIQFLYTAPVSRRSLLHYKLLRSQLGILFGVLIAGVFAGAARAALGGRFALLVGGWLLFAVMFLHVLGISLTKASLRAPARRTSWRAWAPAGVMFVLSALLIGDVARWALALPAEPTMQTLRSLVELGRHGAAGVALWPFRAIVAPLFASSLPELAKAVVPALALAALNYAWVLRSDVIFEEATIAIEKREARGTRRARAPVVRAAPFALSARGRPETAIVWKNLILLGRYASLRTLLRVVLPLAMFIVVLGSGNKGVVVAPLMLMVAAFATILGPILMRNDLRHDMPRLAVLKTWPVRGITLLVGELGAPAIVLTTIVWCAVAMALALSGSIPSFSLPVGGRVTFAILAGLIAPMLIVGQLLVQNAAVIFFPGWIQTGGGRARGIETMGQNILMFAGTLLALVVGVLPAALLGAVAGFFLYSFFGLPGLIPAGVLAAGVLVLEAALVLVLLGRILERTDPTQVEAAD